MNSYGVIILQRYIIRLNLISVLKNVNLLNRKELIMKHYIKEVLALRCSSKLPIYNHGKDSVFLALDFPMQNVQVCRFKFNKYRDRFMVVVYHHSLTFQEVRETITTTVTAKMLNESEVVLDRINIYPLSELPQTEKLEENKKYIQVSTKTNKFIDGLDLIDTFMVI